MIALQVMSSLATTEGPSSTVIAVCTAISTALGFTAPIDATGNIADIVAASPWIMTIWKTILQMVGWVYAWAHLTVQAAFPGLTQFLAAPYTRVWSWVTAFREFNHLPWFWKYAIVFRTVAKSIFSIYALFPVIFTMMLIAWYSHRRPAPKRAPVQDAAKR